MNVTLERRVVRSLEPSVRTYKEATLALVRAAGQETESLAQVSIFSTSNEHKYVSRGQIQMRQPMNSLMSCHFLSNL